MARDFLKGNLLNSIRVSAPKRNRFNLSHSVLTTFNMGNLVPCMLQECVPGDTYNIGTDTLIRLQPMVFPVMHLMQCRVETYFVPMRIVFKDWENFITQKSVVAAPVLHLTGEFYDNFRLIDYLGLPRPNLTMPVSAIPFACYQAVWNEFYRDQNLQAEVNYQLVPGSNDSNPDLLPLRNRAWGHDRFTSALPFAQNGPAVDIPLGTTTPSQVKHNNLLDSDVTFVGENELGASVDGVTDGDGNLDLPTNALWVGEQDIVPTTINELRISYALQRYYELFARGGKRYYEMIKAFFGVTTSDARLQRPEFVVGAKTPVIVSEVLNTTGQVTEGSEPGLPQGSMAGHGVTFINGNLAQYSCEEHGYLITLISVLPETMYQQGIPKTFLRTDPTDYYTPQFDHLGEEPIENREVYVNHSVPTGTFGYTPRNSDYKVAMNRVCGEFKSTLADWHLGRIFETEPNLNANFVAANPSKRIFAVVDEEEDGILAQVMHRIDARRPMSRYSTPI